MLVALLYCPTVDVTADVDDVDDTADVEAADKIENNFNGSGANISTKKIKV